MSKKLTQAQLDQRIKEIHGDELILDFSTYTNLRKRSKFIDKDYGEFWNLPCNILNGQGHKKRSYDKAKKTNMERRGIETPRSLPIDIVIERIKEIHGDTIELIQPTYTKTHNKAKFIDKDYGEFWIAPDTAFRGVGHKKRGSEKRKNTNISKYGVEFIGQLEDVKQKSKITCQIKYGTDYSFQAKVVKDKIIKTNLLNFGVHYSAQSEVVKAKSITTNIKKYGVSNVFQNKEIREKYKQTMLNKYNKTHPMYIDQFKSKMVQTNLKKYGVSNPMRNHEIALKCVRSINKSTTLHHWATQEEIVCVGSYEVKVVNYLNLHKINYLWQPETFNITLLSGQPSTYRPDLYLTDEDKWIEIKGYFYDDAREKWDIFSTTIKTNSELWNQTKLKSLKIL